MKNELTLEQIEKRFAEIDALPAEKPTQKEIAAFHEAADPTEVLTLDEYKEQREYSGKLLLRIPKELHRELAKAAKDNGVSLNQYALYKLAK